MESFAFFYFALLLFKGLFPYLFHDGYGRQEHRNMVDIPCVCVCVCALLQDYNIHQGKKIAVEIHHLGSVRLPTIYFDTFNFSPIDVNRLRLSIRYINSAVGLSWQFLSPAS